MTDQQLVQIAAKQVWSLVQPSDCVAWVGSGPSVGIYPDWPQTVIELCERCSVAKLDQQVTDANALIDKAEDCRRVDRVKYEQTLADLFGRPPQRQRAAYAYLAKLPFRAYATTNVDPLLYVAAGRDAELFSYPNLPVHHLGSKLCVYYMHGIARVGGQAQGTNLVFARSEFDDAYHGGSFLSSFLEQLLAYQRILFVGCRLSESYIAEVFSRVQLIHERVKQRGLPQPDRRILLPGSPDGDYTQAEREEEARFNDLGILAIRYPPTNESHIGLEQVLESVCGLARLPGYVTAGEALPNA